MISLVVQWFTMQMNSIFHFHITICFFEMQIAGEVFRHKYSRRRPADGWKFTIEKMGPRGKRGGGGGWKFVSLPDGSSRPLNEMEKMYVRRETPRHRRKILP